MGLPCKTIRLREAGLWLSDRLVADVLQQAGEA
jgi:hypothetical protein